MNEDLSVKVKEVIPLHLLVIEYTQLDRVSKGLKSAMANGNLKTTQDASQQLLSMSIIHHKLVFIVFIKLPIMYI
jgi:hypothetical protein